MNDVIVADNYRDVMTDSDASLCKYYSLVSPYLTREELGYVFKL